MMNCSGITRGVDRPTERPVARQVDRWWQPRAQSITGPPANVSVINLVRTGYTVPAADATNQQLDVSVQWARPSMAQSYDVLIGPSAGAMVKDEGSPQTARVFVPTLALDSTYYMRIDAVNSLGTTTGDVFSFSTWDSSAILLDENNDPITDETGEYIETAYSDR